MKIGEQESLFSNADNDNVLDNLKLERPLVVFDLETTGLDMKSDRIVQFAFLRVNPDHSQDEWVEIVNPGIPIPIESSRVHHIMDDMVKDKPQFSHFAPKIKEFLANCDLSGYNINRFDLPFLQKEMERNNEPLVLTDIKVIDAQVIFHKREPRTLAAAYKFYCGGEHADAHDAMGDVRVTLEILNSQLETYHDLPRNVSGLHEYTNVKDDRFVTPDRKFYWRYGQAAISFGKYKGKSLKWICEHDADYLKWMKGGDFSDETKKMVEKALNGIFPIKEKTETEDE